MNKSNFLNSLRDETIQEYLHSDRNRSSLLAHQIRKSVSNFEGVTDPVQYEQLNELELRNANANVNEIKQKLLDTFNNLNTLYNVTTYNTTKYSKLYNNIGNYTTVLIDYNRLVTLYLTTTNNVLTRQTIFAALMGTKEVYNQLEAVTLNILDNYDQITDPRMRETAIRKYFVKVLLLYSLYNIIGKQFAEKHFFVIPENNILTNIKLFAPAWIKNIIDQFRLSIELYGIAPNIPSVPPQPPQIGGLPPPTFRPGRPGGGPGGGPAGGPGGGDGGDGGGGGGGGGGDGSGNNDDDDDDDGDDADELAGNENATRRRALGQFANEAIQRLSRWG